MAVGIALFVVAVLIIAIWVFIEIKRLRHKVFAMFLIALILFAYISFAVVIKDRNLDFKSIEGWIVAGKIYFSWLGSIFGNLKTITTNAIKMDWAVSET
ncbi:MAG: hypothetical protein KKF48_00535 [Nanoarchaeota archaeon]|nr:hypothetical protein [Nanoarchaeota archaeon]MBU1027511.1 hypothetical protein [Nanoarchaeota archaeon]